MDQMENNMTYLEYKNYHESFMQNNHGSSPLHTFMCILFTVQCSLLCAISTRRAEEHQIINEYVVVILPMILAHTILAEYIYVLNSLIFILLFKRYMLSYPTLEIGEKLQAENISKDHKILSITCMRGLTYLITVFAILAVDFKSFPRQLAKTEKFGFSFMDTGVGLFVLMSGLVHKNACHSNLTAIIKSNVKFVTVLFFLGVARFVSVKQLDYQEHVPEYGVHWNFFFTLAVCKLFSSIILSYTNHSLLTSILILLVHENLLYIGLEGWIMSNTPRTNIINANREGITSSLGYVSMYLFAAYLKQVLCDKTAFRYKIQIKLLMISILLWAMTFTINYYRPASRTLANAGYCIFLEGVLLSVISLIFFLETQFQDKFKVPLILEAINDNGLIYFLVANLCTGAINMSMRTLFAQPLKTFYILNIYMISTTAIVIYLRKKNIKM